jgi:3-oxoadipate:acetyl-CoA acetyltransferase
VPLRDEAIEDSAGAQVFNGVMEGVVIVQFSSGSRGRDPSTRGGALYLRSEMASLSTGAANLPTIVENVITGAISESFQ